MTPSLARRWLILIVATAGILGSIGLGRPSLWIDEVHSWEFAALPSFGLVILNTAARDAYPPLYFVLLHAWSFLGTSEVWLRSSSLLCHLATIPLLWVLGRKLAGDRVGLVAAAIFALNPFHLAFAREIRMYSLVALLATASMWSVGSWIATGSRSARRATLWTGILLLYTHFICALLLVAEWLAVRFAHRKGRWLPGSWKWVLVTSLAFLPWSPLFLKSLVTTHGYGAEAPVPELAFCFLAALGAGFAKPEWLLLVGAAVVAVAAIVGLMRAPAGTPRRLLALWAFVPPGLELLSAAVGKPVFGERTLIVSTPAWLILAAIGIVRSGALVRWPLAAAVAMVSVASHVHEIGANLPAAPAHREALAAVVAAARPGDVIVHSATVTYHAAHEYYLPRLSRTTSGVLRDYLVEERGTFTAGKLGMLFRDGWRRIRARLDPAGAIRTGTDPSRIPEADLLAASPRRIFYLRTTTEGARRLWRLIPSVYYSAPPAKVFTRSMNDLPNLHAAYRLDWVVDRQPGLVVELWVRR